MIVCVCSNVSDHQIREAISGGDVLSMEDLQMSLNVSSQCGSCFSYAEDMLAQQLGSRFVDSSLFYNAA